MTPSLRLRRLLLAGLIGSNLLALLLSGYSLYLSRQQFELRAEVLSQNIASALDQNLSSSIEKIDLALRTVADELERQLATQGLNETAMNAFMRRQEERLPEVEAFRVANASGLVILGKGLNKSEQVTWADRDYFLYHQAHAERTLQFTKPRVGRVAKRSIVNFSVRYNDPSGKFAGVISAPIAVDHFSQLLSQFDAGPHGTLVLRDADLGLIARIPAAPEQPFGQIGHNKVSPELRQLVKSSAASTTYHNQATSDGVERTLTFHRLSKAPMLVNVGIASQDYLASWHKEVYLAATMMLGFLLLSLLSGGLLLRLLAQATQREKVLRQSEAMLNHAQQVAHLGSFNWEPATGKMQWSDEHFRLWGLEPQSVAPNYPLFCQGIAPDDLAHTDATLQQALRDGGLFECEYRVIWPDASEHHIRAQGETTLNHAGQANRVTGTVQDLTLQKQAEAELKRSETKFRTLYDSTADAVWLLDDTGFIDCNKVALELFGCTRKEDLHGKCPSDLSPSVQACGTDSVTLAHQLIALAFERGRLQFEWLHQRLDTGETFPTEVLLSAMELDGKPLLQAVVRDITERKRAELQLRIAATAFEAQEGMVVTDTHNVILRVNQAFSDITGYTAEEVVGRNIGLLRSGHHNAAFYTDMWKRLQGSGSWQGEIWNRRKNGEVYPQWLTITAVKSAAASISHYVATLTDITLRKAAEDEVKHLAFYDPLTRLPNRRLLLDRLQQALVASTRSERMGALLFIDLDNFKTLNDTLGHDFGDRLLQQVAERLATCVREGDTVARLGGDEFVVMLEGLSANRQEAATQTETVGRKILHTLNSPYRLADQHHHSSASIGATLFNDSQNSVDELMKRADLAMYQSKAAGRNTLRFFDPQMQADVTARATLEADLRQGLQEQAFLLYYQGQVDQAGCMTGAEALVRWQHPQRGLVSPAEFIPVAEESGLILPLGLWVLETACAQLAQWARQPALAHLTLAVNVSAKQFHQPQFVSQVQGVLARSGVNPQRLKLELTESLLINDVEGIIAKMTTLKAQGVGFSLDDFGTGYSSLSYLKRLPLDQLKIDQGFVHDILTDPNDSVIAKMVIALGESLGLAVIAEGVETQAQREHLAGQGCHAYQGYLFSRPMPVDAFETLLSDAMLSIAADA